MNPVCPRCNEEIAALVTAGGVVVYVDPYPVHDGAYAMIEGRLKRVVPNWQADTLSTVRAYLAVDAVRYEEHQARCRNSMQPVRNKDDERTKPDVKWRKPGGRK